jgi:hypothetical protein
MAIPRKSWSDITGVNIEREHMQMRVKRIAQDDDQRVAGASSQPQALPNR